jgi:hypothetical protein
MNLLFQSSVGFCFSYEEVVEVSAILLLGLEIFSAGLRESAPALFA